MRVFAQSRHPAKHRETSSAHPYSAHSSWDMVVDTNERTPLINGLDDARIAEAQEALKNKDSPEHLSRSRVVTILAANWVSA